MPRPSLNPVTARELLKRGIHLLREARVPSDTLAAELLLLHVTNHDRTWLYSHPEEIVPERAAAEFLRLVQRRLAGEPTQHLTGHQEFWGLDFEVTPEVLIPRPETEHLLEVALDRLAARELRAGRRAKLFGEGLSIIDIGTGSGCIAVALAKELPDAQIFATDISTAALGVAQRNATGLGFASRVTFLASDLLSAFSSASHPSAAARPSPLLFDLVVSNPPYIAEKEKPSLPIEVREHEPSAALFGGEEGYEIYGRLVPEAARYLKSGGLLVLELGHDSLPAVRPLLESPEWTNLLVTKDLAGIPRVLSAERAST